MKDEDFDNIFGGKLKRGKNFVFGDDNWDRMEKNLQNFNAERKRKRGLVWFILPFLALLGFSVWSVISLNKLQNKISDLNTEVGKLEKAKSSTPIQEQTATTVKHDTVYQHVIIKKYDTIYRTVIIQNHISENNLAPTTSVISSSVIKTGLPQSVSEASVKKDNTAIQKEEELTDNEIVVFKVDGKKDSVAENQQQIIFAKEAFAENISQKESFESTKKMGIPKDSSENSSHKNVAIEHPLTPQKLIADSVKSEKKIAKTATEELPKIQPLKTSKFEIGVSSGYANIYGDTVLRQSGISAGLRGNYLINKRLKFVADVQWTKFNYEKTSITYYGDIPWNAPPTVNDAFSRVLVEQEFLNYNLGLAYSITQNKRITPNVGIGILAQTRINQNCDYRYINRVLQTESSVTTNGYPSTFKFPLLRLSVGAEMRVFKNISAQLESSYDVKFNNDISTKSLLQVRGVVLYRL